jgi:hypothetical protein
MRTSVGSVAAAPFCGSCWRKSDAGAARRQTGSSSTPSSVIDSSPIICTAAISRRSMPPIRRVVCTGACAATS